jgi:sugar-specific transcriptional regulator TrmB
MEKELLNLGFNKNEIKVYLALLKLGISSVTEISKNSNVERTLVYGVLEKLIHRGLVSSVVKSNKKYFEPADPERLNEIISERKQEIESVLPQLKSFYVNVENKQEVHHFSGKEGIKTILETLLKSGKEWNIFGTSKIASEIMAYYFPQFHRKRIENKIKFNAIYSEDSLDRAKEIQKLKLTSVKILPKEYLTPTHISVVGNKVGIILWSENPLGILIENKEIAESFNNYFKLLWKIAKDLK